MTSSQPQALAVLRDKLEVRYREDQKKLDDDMSALQKEGVDYWVELMKAKESRVQGATSKNTTEGVSDRGADNNVQGEEQEEKLSIAESTDSDSFMLPYNIRERLVAAETSTVREG